jgi:hypothetical protein
MATTKNKTDKSNNTFFSILFLSKLYIYIDNKVYSIIVYIDRKMKSIFGIFWKETAGKVNLLIKSFMMEYRQ